MRSFGACGVLVIVWLGSAGSAPAGLFEDLYRGLDLIATPFGSPTSATGIGGAQNGQRFGRLRVVPNRAGEGYRLEFNRTFGNDSTGRPEVLDLGAMELELNGSISSTAGYTTRLFNIGNIQTNANNVAYALRGKSGAQDFTLSGTFNMAQNLEVNEFGFYTLSLNIANDVSALTLDGVAVDGSVPTVYEVGPISIKGNIFVDAFGAILAGMGVDTSALSDIFPESPIDRISAAIREELTKQGGERASLIAGQLDLGQIGVGLGSPQLSLPAATSPISDQSLGLPQGAPEPATLALLLGGAVLALRRRRSW
ncbi:MAG TPA: PEP-CTERM sorting domain-containing protein [Phycisphaerae bacterium]|nr:PEP-CTERM sorting domain-containing protein [Phycisphaerae bacterium]